MEKNSFHDAIAIANPRGICILSGSMVSPALTKRTAPICLEIIAVVLKQMQVRYSCIYGIAQKLKIQA
jgi:hypothetical protein